MSNHILPSAPIILGNTAHTRVALDDFVAHLATHDNRVLAEAEARRLSAYFKKMSVAQRAIASAEETALLQLLTPDALAERFNMAAEATHNTLLSEVIVSTPYRDSVFKSSGARLMTKKFFPYYIDTHGLNFGFVQVHENKPQDRGSSTAFAILSICDDMANILRRLEPLPLLDDLQKIATLVNHDMLHHMTSAVLFEPSLAHKFNNAAWYLNQPVKRWALDMSRRGSNMSYERWAMSSHGQNLLSQPHDDLTRDTCAILDNYYATLRTLSAQMPERGFTDISSPTRYKFDNYFSRAMGHMLTRLFPLDHAVMRHWQSHDLALVQDRMPQTSLEGAAYLRRETREILAAYNEGHRPIVPPAPDLYAAQDIRLLTLIGMSKEETAAHVPDPARRVKMGIEAFDTLHMVKNLAAMTPPQNKSGPLVMT